jgi:LPXTG-motif cell wall-anchored protein
VNRSQFCARAVAAVLIGLSAILTFANPASAHHAAVSGTASCDTAAGEWVITWTVQNSQRDKDATLLAVTASPDTPVAGIKAGSVVPRQQATAGGGQLTGVQRVPAGSTEATLTVAPDWPRNDENGKTYSGSVPLTGGCAPTRPGAEFVSACDGAVDVHLSNTGKDAASFEVTAGGGFTETVSVAPGQSATVHVPAASAGKITVTSEGRAVASGSWQRPKACAMPTVVAKSDCANLTVTIANPKGNGPVTANVAYGTQSKKLTVAPGGEESVKFPASSSEVATVTFEGLDLELEAVATPASCGGGGGLPKTGAAVGGYVASAAGLLGIGAGLFYLARRRRIRFTA